MARESTRVQSKTHAIFQEDFVPLFALLSREWNESTKKVSISQITRADSGADSQVDSRAISQAIFLAMRIRPQGPNFLSLLLCYGMVMASSCLFGLFTH